MTGTPVNGATREGSEDTDRAAARRLLLDMKERMENLTCELRDLHAAMDGPPGAVSALAAELPDRDQARQE